MFHMPGIGQDSAENPCEMKGSCMKGVMVTRCSWEVRWQQQSIRFFATRCSNPRDPDPGTRLDDICRDMDLPMSATVAREVVATRVIDLARRGPG